MGPWTDFYSMCKREQTRSDADGMDTGFWEARSKWSQIKRATTLSAADVGLARTTQYV